MHAELGHCQPMINTPPPLLPPHLMPPVRTPADVEMLWRRLMGPLGFERPALWTALLDAEGHLLPALQEMTDRADRPDPVSLARLVELQSMLLAEHAAGGSGRVAFLLTRPGSRVVRTADRVWAAGLAAAARAGNLACAPVHLATDEEIREVVLDDL